MNNFPTVICCLYAVFTHFITKIYSKCFHFSAATAEKWVIWGLELRLQISVIYFYWFNYYHWCIQSHYRHSYVNKQRKPFSLLVRIFLFKYIEFFCYVTKNVDSRFKIVLKEINHHKEFFSWKFCLLWNT